MPRYANHVRVFRETQGDGPWLCVDCSTLIHKLGRHKGEGQVHHLDEDKLNNEPSNLIALHTECHRRRHMLGSTQTAETRAKKSQSAMGHAVSEETRAKIAAANRGNKYSIGRKLSDETKRKIGDAQRRRYASY